jgi:hypothetical protein
VLTCHNRGAAAVIVLFFLTVKPRKPDEKDNMTLMDRIWQYDIIGSFLFVPSMVCLLLAIQWGGTTYPWSNGRVIALFVVFGVLLIGFVLVQLWNGSDATGEATDEIRFHSITNSHDFSTPSYCETTLDGIW